VSEQDDVFGVYEDGSAVFEAEDGAIVVFDADGEPVQAWFDGEEIDASGYVVEYEDDYEDPRLAEISARMDALEAQPPPTYAPADAGPSAEDIEEGWRYERQRMIDALGYTTTAAQDAALAARSWDAGHFSLITAAEEAIADGAPILPDLDEGTPSERHEKRIQQWAALLSDVDGTGPDPISGLPPRHAETYNMATHQGRADYAGDAMAGHDMDGRTYDPEEI
jgi:hypothetical protein